LIGDLRDFVSPIDNTKLLNLDGTVRQDLVEERDFMDVSLEAWDYFVKQYGGGPFIVYDWDEGKFIRIEGKMEE